MQNKYNISLDVLLQQIRVYSPRSPYDVEEAALRTKLREQLFDSAPEVVLEQLDLDLNSIILKVKKSLYEFQRRIDESVAKQQTRRTTRVRKSIAQDSAVGSFFNNGVNAGRRFSTSTVVKSDAEAKCSNSKCCHEFSELSDLVKVESLPLSATTNVITIFVPSILQEKMHSCKYKISIDLNRLDLTKKILDLNVGQQVNSNLEVHSKESTVDATERGCDNADQNDQENKDMFQIKSNIESNALQLSTATQNVDGTENNAKIEIKASPVAPNMAPPTPPLQPLVSIMADVNPSPQPTGKKRGPKTKNLKRPSDEPPKKRGRKPGSKNKKPKLIDEKSEIAKYVEMFGCTTGSPSAVSQIVTSTTQNWEAVPVQEGQIAYYMNGEWTLGATPNPDLSLVSTTNGPIGMEQTAGGGQQTYIPFDEFVNYIEDPSLNAGNNVIARVLDASVDTAQCSLNQVNPSIESLQVAKIVANTNSSPKKTSMSKINDENSKVSNNKGKTIVDQGVPNLSIENNISANVDVLNLTQNKSTSSPDKQSLCQENTNVTDKTIVFSTSRSMPALDYMDGDLFCTNPHRVDNLEKKVIFSMTARTSPHHIHKSLVSSNSASITSSAIEMERSDSLQLTSKACEEIDDFSKNTPISVKDKAKPEVVKGMSLLEIENDIDHSLLDFDNCMDDDLLSLAPSFCLNTPADDRFAGSNFLDIDDSNEKLATNIDSFNITSAPAPRSHLELNFPKTKEDELNPALKNFKIPRIKTPNETTSSDFSTVTLPINNIPKQHDLENTLNMPVLSAYPGGGPKPIVLTTPSSISIDASCPSNTSPEPCVSRGEISKMFGSLCYGFLVDKCFESACKNRHQLLELGVLVNSLRALGRETLQLAYKFICRHHKLFKCYFPIFCEEYMHRCARSKLSSMITDCEMQPNCLQYIRNIYTALISSGLNPTNACRFILSRVKATSHVTIDILLDIIIESGPLMFYNKIEQFSQIPGYKFRMNNINGMASACLRSGSAELITVLIKCLISVDQTEFVTMRSPELVNLLEMIKDGGLERC